MSPTLRRPCPRCHTTLIASPAKFCATCERERDRERGTTTERGLGWSYQSKRRRILERDGYVCQICGEPATTVDHIIPRARGGDSSDENLRAACLRCNSGRR